jgi:hypothetical protein
METVGLCQVLWLVMLKSAKDKILRVDTTGQHVPPRVRHGMSCLLISDAVGSVVPCSDEWEVAWSFTKDHMVQEGRRYCDYPRKP